MNVTAASRIEFLRDVYTTASETEQQARQQLDEATVEFNQRADEADQMANRINRWVKLRQKMPMVGMGSFIVGITATQVGVQLASPLLLGVGLLGLATSGACILGIETWKKRGPVMRAEHDRLIHSFLKQQGRVESLGTTHQRALKELATAEAALRKEESQIDELKRLLKPPTPGGVSERKDSVFVGAVRVPKRVLPEKR